MKKITKKSPISKIKKDIIGYVLDESGEISKEDALKLASLSILSAGVIDTNAATICVLGYTCGC